MPLRESIKNCLDHRTLASVDMFEQALYELVHHSAGEIGTLSGRMGYSSPEALANEVCLTNQRFKFGALEMMVALLKVPSRDRERFLTTLDSLVGRGEVSSHKRHCSSLMRAFTALGKEHNDVTTALFESLEFDGELDDRERLAMVAELDDVIDKANEAKDALVAGVPVNG